jgi:dTMP kinase
MNSELIKGNFIIIDGIDGSGKSTVMKAWVEYLQSQNKNVFDIKDYWQQHHRHPEVDELLDYDIIITGEPTYVWTGAAIRQEMIKNGTGYSTTSIADAYALDRLVLYRRLILPLLEAGKTILQDRSVSTSLCYQSVQDNPLPMETIATLEGNAFALQHAPDHLIIADVPVDIAMTRLGGRSDKQDDAIFEKEDFLHKSHDRFLDTTYQDYFTRNGTQIHILDCSPNIDIMKASGINVLQQLLS